MAKKKAVKRTKEEVYDDVISPLMSQIIATCKEHKIAMVASFGLDSEGLVCTSLLIEDEFDPPDGIVRAAKEIQRKPSFLAFTISSGD